MHCCAGRPGPRCTYVNHFVMTSLQVNIDDSAIRTTENSNAIVNSITQFFKKHLIQLIDLLWQSNYLYCHKMNSTGVARPSWCVIGACRGFPSLSQRILYFSIIIVDTSLQAEQEWSGVTHGTKDAGYPERRMASTKTVLTQKSQPGKKLTAGK